MTVFRRSTYMSAPTRRCGGAVPRIRNTNGGCPFCSGTRVTDTNSLAIQKPKIAAELHPSKNGALSSVDLHVSSHKKVWWRCATDPEHEWKTTPHHRTGDKGSGCPFCSGTRVTDENSLATLKPAIADQFHPSKNGKLTPDTIHACSDTPVWWRCSTDQRHEWKVKPNGRNGCPFCSGHRVLEPESLAAMYPRLAKEFHPSRNPKYPGTELSPKSKRPVWWQCRKNHEWKERVSTRVKRSIGCPECAGFGGITS
eukprot:1059499_1